MGKETSGVAVDPPEVLARIEEGLEVVNIVASFMHRQFHGYLPLDDLVSSGREALLSAARSYSPERMMPFRHWASIRIRGAMIDTCRQSGNVPRRVYRKLKALQAAELTREPALEEQATTRPSTPEAADALLGDQLATSAMAMAAGFLRMGSNDALDHAVDPSPGPESSAGHSLLVARIQAVLKDRPDAERILITRYYFEEKTLDEIAKELGLSKSWTSRLHMRAIKAVHDTLFPPPPEEQEGA